MSQLSSIVVEPFSSLRAVFAMETFAGTYTL
jgi:hypothetical protein